jgi:hypothetical protein
VHGLAYIRSNLLSIVTGMGCQWSREVQSARSAYNSAQYVARDPVSCTSTFFFIRSIHQGLPTRPTNIEKKGRCGREHIKGYVARDRYWVGRRAVQPGRSTNRSWNVRRSEGLLVLVPDTSARKVCPRPAMPIYFCTRNNRRTIWRVFLLC